ncbi:MAG TPA: phage integrase SAM-like domain-containing protein [Bacteroidales bacterium]|nr:phage integrase SAM-like domain-containing protein [Bacteroidales bacterium]
MKKLEYKNCSGLQIVCQKCNRAVHKSMTVYNGCKHEFDNQYYKLVLPDPNIPGKRRTKKLTTKSLNEAITALVEFKEELCSPVIMDAPKVIKPMLLLDCMAVYIDYKNDVNVPAHEKATLSKNYLDDLQRCLEKFPIFLKEIGVNVKTLKVDEVTENHVGGFYKYLDDKKYAAPTFNHCIKHLRMFYEYLIVEKDYENKNPFRKAKLKPIWHNPQTINAIDFYDLIDGITPEDSIKVVGKNNNRKNRYRPWLKDVFRLAAYTGRRLEELVEMKWNWIVNGDKGEPIYLQSPDLKVNAMQHNRDKNNSKVVFIPIIEELMELLLELGYEQKKGLNDFIIASDEVMSRQTMIKYMSKSFSFYFEKLNRGYIKNLKHLRKTYISRLEMATSGISIKISGQSSMGLINSHYKDHKYFAEQIAKSEFRVYEKRELLINKL